MDARPPSDDAEAVARASAQAMWASDNASQGLGMTLVSVTPGAAVMSMTIRKDMVNGHGICHGGFMFTLADSAFAFACNSHGEPAVAQQCAVTFIRPVREGEVLTAHALERSRVGRGGIYDVTVRAADGSAVAEFRGHSRTIGGRSPGTKSS